MEEEKKKRLVRKLLFRIALALIVGGAAVILLKRQSSNPIGGSQAETAQEIEIKFADFLEKTEFEWSVTDKFKAAIKLASAFPVGKDVHYRFDGYLVSPGVPTKFEMTVSYGLLPADQGLRIANPKLVDFDLESTSGADAKEYRDAGAAVFALFAKDVRTLEWPLGFTPNEILRMTRAAVIVK